MSEIIIYYYYYNIFSFEAFTFQICLPLKQNHYELSSKLKLIPITENLNQSHLQIVFKYYQLKSYVPVNGQAPSCTNNRIIWWTKLPKGSIKRGLRLLQTIPIISNGKPIERAVSQKRIKLN